jgi:hypothetical protein
VTRLGKFSPFRWLFTSASLLKLRTEGAEHFWQLFSME